MRNYLIAFVVLCTPMKLPAEPQVGGKVGLNFANVTVEPDGPELERTYKLGISAGGFLQVRYLEPIVSQMEVLFTKRGTDTKLRGENAAVFDFDYIDLLLLARPELAMDYITLYGLAGPELSILLTATSTYPGGVENDQREDFRTFDLGVLIGVGMAVGPFPWGTITFEARYDHGFINIDKVNEGITVHNQTIAFLVGYEYRRDRDGDGIADSDDRCPREAEDRDGFEDSDGCPDPDNDDASAARPDQ